jgi:hypothetical protein
MKTRADIVADARRIHAEAEQYVLDCESWFANSPYAEGLTEEQLNVPEMRRIRDRLWEFLEREMG